MKHQSKSIQLMIWTIGILASVAICLLAYYVIVTPINSHNETYAVYEIVLGDVYKSWIETCERSPYNLSTEVLIIADSVVMGGAQTKQQFFALQQSTEDTAIALCAQLDSDMIDGVLLDTEQIQLENHTFSDISCSITSRSVRELLSGRNGQFYGTAVLSQVGFNDDMNKAFVIVKNKFFIVNVGWGPGGMGMGVDHDIVRDETAYYLLKRTFVTWEITGMYATIDHSRQSRYRVWPRQDQ